MISCGALWGNESLAKGAPVSDQHVVEWMGVVV